MDAVAVNEAAAGKAEMGAAATEQAAVETAAGNAAAALADHEAAAAVLRNVKEAARKKHGEKL